MGKVPTYASVVLIAAWMIAGGFGHFLKPDMFYPIVPDFLPKKLVVYVSGAPELIIGFAVLWPRTRAVAGLGFALLCTAFLPLHVWDLFRENPAITQQSAAIIRVFVQFFLIWVGWTLYKRERSETP